MCCRSLAFLAVVICISSSADGRPFLPWSCEKLNEHADIVAIVTVKSTEAWDETFDKTLLGSPDMVGRLTTLRVKTVLKGKRPEGEKELQLIHFEVSKKTKSIENGPRLPALMDSKGLSRAPQYLVFLKMRYDGKFEPVSGQVDSAYSVMVLKPELTPLENDE